MFGSNPFKGVQRRLSRGLSRAGEILTGVGPTPTKQFKNAIIDGDEEKAISIYTSTEGEICLLRELDPSKPFPSKKSQQGADTPLHLSTKFGLIKLLILLLEHGGDPSTLNSRGETCLHSVCSQSDQPETRAAILDLLVQWRGRTSDSSPTATALDNTNKSSKANAAEDGVTTRSAIENDGTDAFAEGEGSGGSAETAGAIGNRKKQSSEPTSEHQPTGEAVSLNQVDTDGNSAIHCAARSGLQSCVEKLVAVGAIISIVNRDNDTCCEVADVHNHKALASMLELALVFQPVDEGMAQFESMQQFPYDNQPGKLFVDCESLSSAGVSEFIEAAVNEVCDVLLEDGEGSCDSAGFETFASTLMHSSPRLIEEQQKQQQQQQQLRSVMVGRAKARAEALLTSYSWNVSTLLEDLDLDAAQVLTRARLGRVAGDTGNSSNGGGGGGGGAPASALKTDSISMSPSTSPPTHTHPSNPASNAGSNSSSRQTSRAQSNAPTPTRNSPIPTEALSLNPPFMSGSKASSRTPSNAPTPPPPPTAEEEQTEQRQQKKHEERSGYLAEGFTSLANYSMLSAGASSGPGLAIPAAGASTCTSTEEDRAQVNTGMRGGHGSGTAVAAGTDPKVALLGGEGSPLMPAHLDGTTHSSSGQGQGTCPVCGEEMLREVDDVLHYIRGEVVGDTGSRQLSCGAGHSFCVDCWSGHLRVQVADNGVGCLPCPGFKCGEVLDLQWAPVLLKSQDLVNRVRATRQQLVVDCCGALKPCPVEGCGLIVASHQLEDLSSRLSHLKTPGSGTGTENGAADTPASATAAGGGGARAATVSSVLPQGALCDGGHLFCLLCSQEAHSPCRCELHTRWLAQVQEETAILSEYGFSTAALTGEAGAGATRTGGGGKTAAGANTQADLANALWVAANTKRCPRCQTPIEKDEGCNHMSCRKCRKEFCWICMQDWSLHSDSTGGYFQCNRFVMQQTQQGGASGGGGDAGGDGERDIWAEERGNAHAETIRLRERNKKMARFLHHFTRFQAHRESLHLEGRMRRETLTRIAQALTDSVDAATLTSATTLAAAVTATAATPNPASPDLADRATTGVSYDGSAGQAIVGDAGDSFDGLKGGSSVPVTPERATPMKLLNRRSISSVGRNTPVEARAVTNRSGVPGKDSGYGNDNGSIDGRSGQKLKWLQGDKVPNPLEQLIIQRRHQAMVNATAAAGIDGAVDNDVPPVGEKASIASAEGTAIATTAAAATTTTAAEGGSGLLYRAGGRLVRHALHRASAAIPTAACLGFLRDGLDELLKCRSILQWSYPYAFYEFEKYDDHDYTGLSGARDRRLHTWGRNWMEDHRTSFELLQADLEGFIETLSDVVARRRLRAGRSQISLATRAARSKRLELESLLVAFALSQQERLNRSASATASGGGRSIRSTAAEYGNGGSGSRSMRWRHREGFVGDRDREREYAMRRTDRHAGYHRTRNLRFEPDGTMRLSYTRQNSRPASGHYMDVWDNSSSYEREAGRNGRPARDSLGGGGGGGMQRSDSEDSIDMATLLLELELAALHEHEAMGTEDGTGAVGAAVGADDSQDTGAGVDNADTNASATAASSNAGGDEAMGANEASARLAAVSDRVANLQLRMQRLFKAEASEGTGQQLEQQTRPGSSEELPPPPLVPVPVPVPPAVVTPTNEHTPARRSKQRLNRRRRGHSSEGPNANTPSPSRRIFSLRQARNSGTPGSGTGELSGGAPGPAPSFSIDSDFSLEDSEEDDDYDDDNDNEEEGVSGSSLLQGQQRRSLKEADSNDGSDSDDDDVEQMQHGTPAIIRVRSVRSMAPQRSAKTGAGTGSATGASITAPATSTPPSASANNTADAVITVGAATGTGVGESRTSPHPHGQRQGQRQGQQRSARDTERLARLTRRAEEEAALNRAILMSLQDSSVAAASSVAAGANTAAAGGEGGQDDGSAGGAEPSEESVQMLMAMGFEREHVVQTLRESRMSVELAANRLLGIDL